jgi:hypothetical protein
MTRSTNKINNAAAADSPTKAAAGKPTHDKFKKAFNQVHNKTFPSSPSKGRVKSIEVDYEVLTPLGTGLITFSQHGQNKHPYVYPLLVSLTDNAKRIYKTLRVFMQAVLFCPETTDRKLKRSSNNTIGVVGLVINFDHQQDHVDEANIGANLLKVVHAFVMYANNLARRPFNREASETFQFANKFREGTNYTRTNPRRRHLGQVISPEDSVAYMERIFEDMTFDQLVCDRDIIEGMYGSVDEGNALVAIASLLGPPFHSFLLSSILTTRFPRPLQYQYQFNLKPTLSICLGWKILIGKHS